MQRLLGKVIRRGLRHGHLALTFAPTLASHAANGRGLTWRGLTFATTARASGDTRSKGVEVVDDPHRIDDSALAIVIYIDVADGVRGEDGTDFSLAAPIAVQKVDDHHGIFGRDQIL